VSVASENQTIPPLILASSSRYRADLLKRLGLSFSQASPRTDETQKVGEQPEQLARRLATEKALTIAGEHPGCLVIGSDQVASLNGEPLGKPGSVERARTQLRRCSGQSVVFYTGLSVAGPATDQLFSLTDTFTVHFRELSNAQISRYIEKELPLDCAGSFKMEGLGISLFEKLEGNDPNTLIGLPLIELVTLLNQRGIAIP
jgi:septum formation protein